MDDGVRINKFLGSAGYCSRREADRLVGEGRVFIDGNMADMGSRVMPGQKVYVDGKAVVPEEENILIAVNKPRGIVCTTTDKQGANNIVDFLGCDKRIYPVGRLDKDSEGLLLMTNDGELMNNILTGKNEHEKEYIVEVDKNLSDDFERRMSEPGGKAVRGKRQALWVPGKLFQLIKKITLLYRKTKKGQKKNGDSKN